MKLLYIAALPIDFENLDGVPKKVISQCKALGSNFAVDLIFYHNGQVRLRDLPLGTERQLGQARNKLDVLRAAAKLVTEGDYGCMYVRYPRSDALFLALLKKAKTAWWPIGCAWAPAVSGWMWPTNCRTSSWRC